MIKVVSIRNITKPLYYSLYDETGKILLTGKSLDYNFSINIEKIGRGIYILKLYNAYYVNLKTEKIIIN